MKAKPPWAQITKVTPGTVTIKCPLCGEPHSHPKWKLNHIEHRLAACHIWAPVNAYDKALGYRYRVQPPKTEKGRRSTGSPVSP